MERYRLQWRQRLGHDCLITPGTDAASGARAAGRQASSSVPHSARPGWHPMHLPAFLQADTQQKQAREKLRDFSRAWPGSRIPHRRVRVLGAIWPFVRPWKLFRFFASAMEQRDITTGLIVPFFLIPSRRSGCQRNGRARIPTVAMLESWNLGTSGLIRGHSDVSRGPLALTHQQYASGCVCPSSQASKICIPGLAAEGIIAVRWDSSSVFAALRRSPVLPPTTRTGLRIAAQSSCCLCESNALLVMPSLSEGCGVMPVTATLSVSLSGLATRILGLQ